MFVRAFLPLIKRFIWRKTNFYFRDAFVEVCLVSRFVALWKLVGTPSCCLLRQMILKITFAFAGRMVSKGNQQGLWRSWIASYLTFRPLLSHHSLRWRRSFGSRKIPIGKADACNREKSDESTAKRTWAPSGTWERDLERFFPKFNTLL